LIDDYAVEKSDDDSSSWDGKSHNPKKKHASN
jgi:hypothetical protein